MNIIKNLFLPDYIFAQNIIGIEIGKHHISACQLYQNRQSAKVKNIVSVPIEQGSDQAHSDKTVSALGQALSRLSGNKIRLSIPNNLVIFKELTLPFLDTQKIRMVLGYEVESTLPFPLHEAVLDFIVLDQNKKEKSTTVLAAITQKKHIDGYVELFEKLKTKREVNVVTTDLFGLYGIYSSAYTNDKNKFEILIDLGKSTITVTYLLNGKIKLVRNLPYGVSNIVAKIASASDKNQKEVIEHLVRFGLNPDEDGMFNKEFEKLINDISFTLNSFKSQVETNVEIKNILLVESALEIKDIERYISKKINLNCETLDLKKISNSKNISLGHGVNITPIGLPSIAAALTTDVNSTFNLMPASTANSQLVDYQIITAAIITLAIFVSVYTISSMQIGKMERTLKKYNTSTLNRLKNSFGAADTNDLDDIINLATIKVSNEKKLWFSFSSETRYSYLRYLQELSNVVDINKINLDLKKLIISDGIMTLQGKVDNFDDVGLLEQALAKAPLFKLTTFPQELSFTIKITLKQSSEE